MTTAADPFLFGDMTKWVPHERETWPFIFLTCKQPLTFHIWNGHDHKHKGLPEYTDRIVPVGATVRIVMVSRFGDVGLTDDLTAEYGYHARSSFKDVPSMFENPRNVP